MVRVSIARVTGVVYLTKAAILELMSATQIHFKNQPHLSTLEAQATFNERRRTLAAQLEGLIAASPIFQGKPVVGEFAAAGVSSLVCFLTCEDATFVLKVPLSLTDGNGEAHFLRQWEAAGVKVPRVLEDGRIGEHPYLIMEFVDAPSLQSLVKQGRESSEGVWGEMGRMLARMHGPRTEGFGRIVEGRPQFDRFEDWLLGPGIEKRMRTVRELGLLGNEHGRIDRVFGALLAHGERQEGSRLCHFDFTPNNILATEPLTVFDPSPMLNHGIIDIGRSMLSCVFHGQLAAAEELRAGYFGGAEYDASALQAAIILNAYWKFPYQHKAGRIAEMQNIREYLEETAPLL